MTEKPGLDPMDLLRAVDPVDPLDVPSASLARVSARVQENIMNDHRSAPADGRPVRTTARLAIFGAAFAALALVAIVGLPKMFGADPTQVAVIPTAGVPTDAPPDSGPITGGGGMAMCIQYDHSILVTFGLVFDGTVTAVNGDQVTFAVNAGFQGAEESEITLTNPAGELSADGSVGLEVGARYLVAGNESTIVGCGYTQPYDPAEAAAWAAAFGG
ncbi:MAG: hypothetical protein ABIZ30_02750 [Candidatus Limnocylindrales bacterium]